MLTKEKDNCPNCGVSFQGDPIPEKSQHLYGGVTHFSRLIGYEVPGVYDGILYWVCPDCDYAWSRWATTNDLGKKAEYHISLRAGR